MAVFQFLPADSLEIYLHAHRPFAYGETEKEIDKRAFSPSMRYLPHIIKDC